ncbi:MAG TPA: transaldolase family protein [Candidatus Dormibacteraeota bacterium]|nr:transaldolase family protein [Candidatus Dormibacteraeota bacterium]
MKFFVDSANFAEIEKWLRQGVVDGVTTNPSIMFKDGVYDVEEGARRISRLLGDRPLSVEVASNDPEEMIRQGREFASWAGNVAVKIPVVNEYGESCLGAVHALHEEGIRVNATAILSFNQAVLAAKAGAAYVSIFAGRVADEGNDPAVVIRNVRHWLDDWNQPAEIIVGSIRAVMDIQNAALAGAHIITVPPQFLPKMVDHQYTRETVRQFNRDAEKALAQIAEARVGTGNGNGA